MVFFLNWNHGGDHIPIILNAGLPCDAGPFGAAAEEEALPALAVDAVELAPAALSAADALDLSDIVVQHKNSGSGDEASKKFSEG